MVVLHQHGRSGKNNVMLNLVPQHTPVHTFFLENDTIKCIIPGTPMTKRDGFGGGGWGGG